MATIEPICAAADDAEGLAGDLHTHEAVLFPFPACVEAFGFGDWRATANMSRWRAPAVVDGVAERRCFHSRMIPRRDAEWDIDIIHADAGPAAESP